MSDKQSTPLWSDEDIANDAKRASSSPTTQATIRSCLLFMRYGYEAERQRLTQANLALAAEVARLKAEAEWEIVPEYKTGHKYGGMYIGRGLVTIWDEEVNITKNLPDNIRLMRRKAEGNR